MKMKLLLRYLTPVLGIISQWERESEKVREKERERKRDILKSCFKNKIKE